jgi:hypothetical protein
VSSANAALVGKVLTETANVLNDNLSETSKAKLYATVSEKTGVAPETVQKCIDSALLVLSNKNQLRHGAQLAGTKVGKLLTKWGGSSGPKAPSLPGKVSGALPKGQTPEVPAVANSNGAPRPAVSAEARDRIAAAKAKTVGKVKETKPSRGAQEAPPAATPVAAPAAATPKAQRPADPQQPAAVPGPKAQGQPVHKNDAEYVGPTRVYIIRNVTKGEIDKVGQTAQKLRKRDGKPIRAESQARQKRRETGDIYETEIRKTFSNKREALTYENRYIKKFRGLFGEDKLPGNKGEH